MPTELPKPRPSQKETTRGAQNLAGAAAVLAWLVLSLWLFHALSNANLTLTCLWSGRPDCDQQNFP